MLTFTVQIFVAVRLFLWCMFHVCSSEIGTCSCDVCSMYTSVRLGHVLMVYVPSVRLGPVLVMYVPCVQQ